MEIRFWGTRGSIPSPGPSTLGYGGNTSCLEVKLESGPLLILDAGSGIRELGIAYGNCDAVLLLTHYHWDHIQGMPFFGPAYSPDSRIRVYGPEYNGTGPGELLTGQMLAPYFPAPASTLYGIEEFNVVREEELLTFGCARVRAGALSHPGLTYGYRIEEGGSVLAYLSDDEPDVAPDAFVEHIVDLARGADLLIHDCQYTDEEYVTRHFWGHSTPSQAVRIALAAGVKRLMLFHHDPSHSDLQVDLLAEETHRILGGAAEVLVAREGATMTLQSASPAGRSVSATE